MIPSERFDRKVKKNTCKHKNRRESNVTVRYTVDFFFDLRKLVFFFSLLSIMMKDGLGVKNMGINGWIVGLPNLGSHFILMQLHKQSRICELSHSYNDPNVGIGRSTRC